MGQEREKKTMGDALIIGLQIVLIKFMDLVHLNRLYGICIFLQIFGKIILLSQLHQKKALV